MLVLPRKNREIVVGEIQDYEVNHYPESNMPYRFEYLLWVKVVFNPSMHNFDLEAQTTADIALQPTTKVLRYTQSGWFILKTIRFFKIFVPPI